MKVLVTGAAGFIGRHVCKELNNAGHTVIGCDVSGPPQEAFSARADICNEWVPADITQSLGSTTGLDAVIHLAAIANPRTCDGDPTKAYLVNVHGTYNVLELARQSGAHKFVFSSSAHVYGIPPRQLPTGEDSELVPQSVYTTTKILGEQLCSLYWHTYRLSYTVLRLFNTYGLEQAPGYFIPDQLLKAQRGNFDLLGSDITKDWVHVTDVADAFVKALTVDIPCTLNIGTGVETNLETIARFIAKAYQVELNALHSDSPTRMCADWGLARSILGWANRGQIVSRRHYRFIA